MPNRRPILAFFAASFLAGGFAAACVGPQETQGASAEPRQTRQCFTPRQVNGFNPIDDDTVDVRISANRVYRLELFGPCPDVDWSLRIGIRSTGGSNWICAGLDAELVVPGPIGPQRCQVSSIRMLTREEIDASRGRRN